MYFSWMQPESYLDAKNCDILYNKEELKCSWPAVITIQTKDQYEQLVNVPNLKVIQGNQSNKTFENINGLSQMGHFVCFIAVYYQ